ncbi:MAG: glycosyltransferase family 4 protein [Candidatus Wallbacteria bacterium]
MKVLQINSNNSGGTAKATARLHAALNLIGVDSNILSKDDFPLAHEKTFQLIKNKITSKMAAKIKSFAARIWLKFYNKKNGEPFSVLPCFNDNINAAAEKILPDIIHLQWIGDGFMAPETIKNFKKPVLMTLHDSGIFTGGCHFPLQCTRYQDSCGSCPALNSNNANDLSYQILKRKKNALLNSKLTLVSPSRWMAECAKKSSLFCNADIEIIPNGIDLKIFKPLDKSYAKRVLSLPENKKILLFGALRYNDFPIKGYPFLISALQKLSCHKNEYEIATFGSAAKNDEIENLGFKTHSFGRLNDEISLALLYAAADIFITPSMTESFGLTALEAIACGTPVAAFAVGGIPDIIEDKFNGILAHPFDESELAAGIEWIIGYNDRYLKLSSNARAKAEKEFDIIDVARKYQLLYNKLLCN